MFKRLGLVASVVVLSAGMATAATWQGGGEIHISGNGLLDVAGVVNLGGNRGKKRLVVTLNGGMLRAGGRLMCPANNMRAGLTTVDLKAGVIQCASFSHAKDAR